MLLGLAGLASQSLLHSRKMSSFSVYMLMLKGSGRPASVTSGMVTFLRLRYFPSILYGCRLPDVRSRVMLQTGPLSAALGATSPMLSCAGPMARTESDLSLVGGTGASSLDLLFGGVGVVSFRPSGWWSASSGEVLAGGGASSLALAT